MPTVCSRCITIEVSAVGNLTVRLLLAGKRLLRAAPDSPASDFSLFGDFESVVNRAARTSTG